jgi:hypothetical protein
VYNPVENHLLINQFNALKAAKKLWKTCLITH